MHTSISPSVISSCSPRPLGDFLPEVKDISGVDLFDLFVFRAKDITQMRRDNVISAGDSQPPTPTSILSDRRNLSPLADWVARQVRESGVKISALATYFPDITSLSRTRQDRAIDALANSVRLASCLVKRGVMRSAIVEIVCGTILDPCECARCRDESRVFISDQERKVKRLVEGLSKASQQLSEGDGVSDYAIGVELEPGDTYVINNLASMRTFFREIDLHHGLRDKTGLNLDVAHMRIVPVAAAELEEFRDRIVHAHISDHPGMHTRDQAVGAWTSVFQVDGAYEPYIRLLADRAAGAGKSKLLFSNAIALELEGCGKIHWVHDSLSSMRHLVTV